SGKTESFLFPILGKLMREAAENSNAFKTNNAVRALILYPMNALVNDQLGRVRNLFQDARLKSLFRLNADRVPTFARYTSRTPYPGIREKKKDQSKLDSFDKFYVEIEQATTSTDIKEREAALQLMKELKAKGKWPAKPSLSKWYGGKGSHWQDKDGSFLRANTLSDDSELITRQEAQISPPDLLITNYSMLEYMLMRPIERSIFEKTVAWLSENPEEKFLIVIDEAHLYRGAAGAEVGLLLRRLRERLSIPPERFQVICSTASFGDEEYALKFASQLSGVSSESFIPITSSFNKKPNENSATQNDITLLSAIDLKRFYDAVGEDRLSYIEPFLANRDVEYSNSIEAALYQALKDYEPLNKLVNLTMGQATPLSELGQAIFPIEKEVADKALAALLALGSMAKDPQTSSGLLPCRIHNFFRGLPGLWVCIDENCTAIDQSMKSDFCGKLYGQPREYCECGSRVFELYTCRNCGTAYARAYTDNLENPSSLWSQQGKSIRLTSSQIRDLYPIDLLLESPTDLVKVETAYLDRKTGRLNANNLGENWRKVFIRRDRIADPISNDDQEDQDSSEDAFGQFITCSVCNKGGGRQETPVQDHQTKGDQPFLSLLSKQIQIQPPNANAATQFAPLRGRKVLVFSDSRQVAAKLAPNLQNYSLRDVLRPLLVWGYKKLKSNSSIADLLSIDNCYLAVLIAASHFDIRLRPELNSSENFDTVAKAIRKEVRNGALQDDVKFNKLFNKYRTEEAPEALLKEIVKAVFDKFTGLEALAIASPCIKDEYFEEIKELPNIPTIAETDEAKIALANYWIRCWQGPGYWLKDMKDSWWKPAQEKSQQGVKGHKSGWFKSLQKTIGSKAGKDIFKQKWLPFLIKLTDDLNGTLRITAKHLDLDFSSPWIRCKTCSSVHRPIPGHSKCLDCQSEEVYVLDTENDQVFIARKGYYRRSVKEILLDEPFVPMAIIAAEHTAQLNAPQSEDIFSKGEENELLFQDIDITWPINQGNTTAIDILSSTTTMEVGIDIGALSGVALRNMPPGRANYQQRAGRAGRRGNAVASVIAFGSVDSHDEHYFSHPKEMISGKVVDPIITLNNVEIVRRHVRAFILQKYHQEKLPEFLPSHHSANLFSVLGSVHDFVSGTGTLNREDFKNWLQKNITHLQERIQSWIPTQLSEADRKDIVENAIQDTLDAVDDATDFKKSSSSNSDGQTSVTENSDDTIEVVEEEDLGKANINDGLLDRLLYRGKLPRYAFPTDVATFHVFDENKSNSFKTVMRFAPSQGLPIALTQYAPDRQVWIANKCYTSGAIYSPISSDLPEAWKRKRLYYECTNCGFAKTEDYNPEKKTEQSTCDACDHPLGKPFNWFRPPGFAHPVDIKEETSPDGMPEVGYATRAKLYMPFPAAENWEKVNERISGLKKRTHLLVSNTGPDREGYFYCVRCGRIESKANASGILGGEHKKPFPHEKPMCEGNLTSTIVLGTDFITDVALFSLDLSPYIALSPGSYTFDVALRTLCEALSKAASQMLEIEPNDVVAEYRPALTLNAKGKTGEQVEIFLYDTLAGGAGFSPQLVGRGKELFERALSIMESCAENCDSSCYRCLRIFRNKFEHGLIDRHVGIELAKFILDNKLPSLNSKRVEHAMIALIEDLRRVTSSGIRYTLGIGASEDIESGVIAANYEGREYLIAISSPLRPAIPINETLEGKSNSKDNTTLIPVDEFLIRNNLPSATQYVLQKIESKI
ncbi:MAG: DUF1998 domain-containing protein, partial [Sphingobacteriales bacterium]|nr:DUF1998 domain-containing protein [Sphingobacteriales bacterium]